MGYNSTIVICNDSLDQIAKDPEFGKNVDAAISKISVIDGPVNISSGGSVNAAQVVETHHADSFRAVVVGCNGGTLLGYAGYWHKYYGNSMTEEDRKLFHLKQIAADLGYSLRKKPKRK